MTRYRAQYREGGRGDIRAAGDMPTSVPTSEPTPVHAIATGARLVAQVSHRPILQPATARVRATPRTTSALGQFFAGGRHIRRNGLALARRGDPARLLSLTLPVTAFERPFSVVIGPRRRRPTLTRASVLPVACFPHMFIVRIVPVARCPLEANAGRRHDLIPRCRRSHTDLHRNIRGLDRCGRGRNRTCHSARQQESGCLHDRIPHGFGKILATTSPSHSLEAYCHFPGTAERRPSVSL